MSLILPGTVTDVRPSYGQGFARNAAEAENPGLRDGLVGLWALSLGPTGLTLFDVSGRRNHGTLTAMDPATDWVTTKKGWALDFAGDDDYVTAPNIEDAIFAANAGTLVLHARPDSLAVDQRAFGCYTGVLGNRQMYMRMDADGGGASWAGGISTDGLGLGNIGEGAVGASATDYQLIALTWNGSTLAIYVDGELRDSVTGARNVNAGAAGYRLGSLDTLGFFDGTIAYGLAYARALALSEIQQLYVDPDAMLRLRQEVFPAGVADESSISTSSVSTSSSSISTSSVSSTSSQSSLSSISTSSQSSLSSISTSSVSSSSSISTSSVSSFSSISTSSVSSVSTSSASSSSSISTSSQSSSSSISTSSVSSSSSISTSSVSSSSSISTSSQSSSSSISTSSESSLSSISTSSQSSSSSISTSSVSSFSSISTSSQSSSSSISTSSQSSSSSISTSSVSSSSSISTSSVSSSSSISLSSSSQSSLSSSSVSSSVSTSSQSSVSSSSSTGKLEYPDSKTISKLGPVGLTMSVPGPVRAS